MAPRNCASLAFAKMAQLAPPDPFASLQAICAEVGFDLAPSYASLLERMRLMHQHSATLDDAKRMAGYAHDVFRYTASVKPTERYDANEQRIVVLGCLFSDVGKTGPERADADARRLVIEMFSVEGVDDDQQSVAAFLRAYFPADASSRIERFAALGLDASMSVRQFWNLHSSWTLDIAESAGLPPEVVAAAASHHLLDDVNPQAIVGDDQRFTRAFGSNARFDRAEKLVIVLDKYDAVRRRGRGSHAQAIAWLRERIASTPRFRGDAELATLVADLDAALVARENPVRHRPLRAAR